MLTCVIEKEVGRGDARCVIKLTFLNGKKKLGYIFSSVHSSNTATPSSSELRTVFKT